MDRLFVTGGARLTGSVRIAGAKNSALKLMAASLLAPGRSVLRNIPRIQDCFTMGEVLEHLGAGVVWDGNTVTIDATTLTSVEADTAAIAPIGCAAAANPIVCENSLAGSPRSAWDVGA